ncbi:hypothetical protein NE237_006863 [Protea cynaroides]|uniref:AATF leucine zipper-containing domain-containing protein n=1 Tax=Protea cynaroides TaxID=273540 RepID=A0A9Q0KNZ5_9MAGN|nr:hypothetical protein NE237_006863 [Protea cynaroides]
MLLSAVNKKKEEGEEQEEQNSQQDAEMEEFLEDESDSENDAEREREQEQEQQQQWEGHGRQKDAEMEELEKEYSNLRNQQLDLLKNLKCHKDDDLLKGQAVRNQKVLWDKALELRFLLHKAFSSSNQLPQEPLRSSFLESDKAVNEAYSEFIPHQGRLWILCSNSRRLCLRRILQLLKLQMEASRDLLRILKHLGIWIW